MEPFETKVRERPSLPWALSAVVALAAAVAAVDQSSRARESDALGRALRWESGSLGEAGSPIWIRPQPTELIRTPAWMRSRQDRASPFPAHGVRSGASGLWPSRPRADSGREAPPSSAAASPRTPATPPEKRLGLQAGASAFRSNGGTSAGVPESGRIVPGIGAPGEVPPATAGGRAAQGVGVERAFLEAFPRAASGARGAVLGPRSETPVMPVEGVLPPVIGTPPGRPEADARVLAGQRVEEVRPLPPPAKPIYGLAQQPEAGGSLCGPARIVRRSPTRLEPRRYFCDPSASGTFDPTRIPELRAVAALLLPVAGGSVASVQAAVGAVQTAKNASVAGVANYREALGTLPRQPAVADPRALVDEQLGVLARAHSAGEGCLGAAESLLRKHASELVACRDALFRALVPEPRRLQELHQRLVERAKAQNLDPDALERYESRASTAIQTAIGSWGVVEAGFAARRLKEGEASATLLRVVLARAEDADLPATLLQPLREAATRIDDEMGHWRQAAGRPAPVDGEPGPPARGQLGLRRLSRTGESQRFMPQRLQLHGALRPRAVHRHDVLLRRAVLTGN
ncbi:MAG: hypothetical protein HY553_02055 [Elusimicrobia bacterium]|nr:hypothetical protein [Elusimicrobiota bacterium]